MEAGRAVAWPGLSARSGEMLISGSCLGIQGEETRAEMLALCRAGRSSWQLALALALALALCRGPMRQPFRRHLCSLSHGFAAGQSQNHRGARQRFITTEAASGKARPQVQCSFEPQGGTAAQPTAYRAPNSAAKRFLGHNEPDLQPARSLLRAFLVSYSRPLTSPDCKAHISISSQDLEHLLSVHFCSGFSPSFRLELLPYAHGTRPHGTAQTVPGTQDR